MENKTISINTGLDVFFKDIPNYFNDQLPTRDYFDLHQIIKKYEALNLEKIKDILLAWKKCLKDVYFYFCELDKMVSQNSGNLEQVEFQYKFSIFLFYSNFSGEKKVRKMFHFKEDSVMQKFVNRNLVRSLSISFALEGAQEIALLSEWKPLLSKFYRIEGHPEFEWKGHTSSSAAPFEPSAPLLTCSSANNNQQELKRDHSQIKSSIDQFPAKSSKKIFFSHNGSSRLTASSTDSWKTFFTNEHFSEGVHSFKVKINKFTPKMDNTWCLIIGFAFSRDDKVGLLFLLSFKM